MTTKQVPQSLSSKLISATLFLMALMAAALFYLALRALLPAVGLWLPLSLLLAILAIGPAVLIMAALSHGHRFRR